ncbi:MAG: TonB-dependent receptor [Leptospiraceae bacterium]|nr:TonB-dependent receptor [Leptospiraceae bacterium]
MKAVFLFFAHNVGLLQSPVGRAAPGLISLVLLWAPVMHLYGQSIDPVIIEATGADTNPASEQPGATTSIALDDGILHNSDLGTILEREAGVRVNRYGGRGAWQSLSLRGSNPNQTNLYIDGIPITNAASGEVNLSDWNVDGLERLDIYRSGDFGAATIGGSVDLVTNKGDKNCQRTRVKGLGGSYRTAGLGLNTCGGEAIRYNMHARAEVSDQDFKFHNDNGTPVLNRQDDYDDIRSNAWYREFFGTLNLSTQWAKTDLGFLLDSAWRNHGVPGPAPGQSEKTERHVLRHTTGLHSDTRGLFLEELRFKSRLFYSQSDTKFFDPRQEFSSAQPNTETGLQHYGLILEPLLYLLDWHQTLRFYLALERESYRQDRRDKDNRYLETLPVRFRNHSIARLADEFSFWGERLTITPAVEYQRIRDRFNVQKKVFSLAEALQEHEENPVRELQSGRIHGRLVFYKSDLLALHVMAGWNSGQRAPLFIELFGDRGSIIGNPDLRPERSETTEGGLGIKIKSGSLTGQSELTVFQRRIVDMILFIPNSRFTLRPENLDAAVIDGLEWSNKTELWRQLRLHANYTWQKAINRSEISYLNGKYLPLRPMHELQAGLSWFEPDWEIGAESSFVGATFRDRTNEAANYIPARWNYNLFARLQFGEYLSVNSASKPADKKQRAWALHLDIKNIYNTRLMDINGYPLPGRSLHLSLSYTF